MSQTPLVSCDWLSGQLTESGALSLQGEAQDNAVRDAGLILFDATYFLTDKTRDPYKEFVDERLPGAQFFDITRIANVDSEWPNTVPSTDDFERAVNAFGCHKNHHVIAYDRLGLFSAARVWWLFRHFGHDNVSVLDGGLPKWTEAGLALASGEVSFPAGDFTAKPQPGLYCSTEQVHGVVKDPASSTQIVDARGAGRFAGEQPEPRQGLRSGHIPGSMSLPFEELLNADKTFKTKEEVRSIIEASGVDLQQPVITSCGSGVTACVISLALLYIGAPDAALYDGSWTEWGSTSELPIETGAGATTG